jgi:hypothetical protein
MLFCNPTARVEYSYGHVKEALTYMHTCIHTSTYIHVCIHTYMYIRTYVHIQSCYIDAYAHTMHARSKYLPPFSNTRCVTAGMSMLTRNILPFICRMSNKRKSVHVSGYHVLSTALSYALEVPGPIQCPALCHHLQMRYARSTSDARTPLSSCVLGMTPLEYKLFRSAAVPKMLAGAHATNLASRLEQELRFCDLYLYNNANSYSTIIPHAGMITYVTCVYIYVWHVKHLLLRRTHTQQ